MTPETINFFTKGKGYFGTPEEFKSSWLYSYFTDLYGEIIFLPNIELEFIKVTEDGYYIDEIYTSDTSTAYKVGTYIPKKLIGNKKYSGEFMWMNLKESGFSISRDSTHPEIKNKILDIEFFKDINLPESILNADPETLHYHILDVAKYANKPRLERRHLETDALKYIYLPEDNNKGPYSFHMDYTPNVYYMYFKYCTNVNPVIGRELVIGERDLNTISWNREGILRSGTIIKEIRIPICDDMVIFMNTYNPKFVHRVEPLRAKQEVITLTTYVYT